MANLSIFIPHETKPGKGKIASLLKSIGFVERTSTPLWSYTYTRLRVDQVDYRDDFYDDSDWLYETEFDTKWAVRVSLHTQHKENHKALWHSLALIISQVYDVEELYINAPGTDVPGPSMVATKLAFEAKESPKEIKEMVEMAVQPTPVVENKTEDEYYPEPTVEVVPEPQPQQPLEPVVEDDWGDDGDEDDWDDDEDDWDDDEDDEVQTLELKPVQSEEVDPWEDEFEDDEDDDEDDDDDDEDDFDGIVTWD